MMRLTTPGNLRLQQSRELSVNYGGSEANVAISVANFGGQVDYVTRLPENPLGEACIAELRSHNIGTDHILTGGKRLGTYYMEKAAAMRNSRVIYDREGEYAMLFGLKAPGFKATSAADRYDTAAYETFCREIAREVPQCRYIYIALRNVMNSEHHTFAGILYADGTMYHTRVYDINNVIDCVGVGDAFCGALLYAQSAWTDNQKRVDFSTAASVLKNTISGDYNMVKVSEVEELMARNEKGELER